MSRAFVKESAEAAPPPERMVDEGPNLVTPEGLAQIEGNVARLEAALKSEINPLLRETLARDLRYWASRNASAQVVAARPLGPTSPNDSFPAIAQEEPTVAFGSRVVIARKGRKQNFRIVGVDEADPSHGLISFRSPLADAILGARMGEHVEADEPLGEIEIVSVD